MRTRRIVGALGGLLVAGAVLVSTAGVAAADAANGDNAFLCPVVGLGAVNGPASPLGDSGKATFLPGQNQAGEHANASAFNAFGGAGPTNLPGTAGFTPIWNPPGP
jgi:hypothetical protein